MYIYIYIYILTKGGLSGCLRFCLLQLDIHLNARAADTNKHKHKHTYTIKNSAAVRRMHKEMSALR